MTNETEREELISELRKQAEEIAVAGHDGCGNTMTRAADYIESHAVAGDVDGLAHELWAAAQLVPGEGIVDGVARIVKIIGETTPAPVDAAVERDATRYRFLRKKIGFSGNGDGTATMHAINLPDSDCFPRRFGIEEQIDHTIDAAIDAQNKDPTNEQ